MLSVMVMESPARESKSKIAMQNTGNAGNVTLRAVRA
jgi:hypothetical protein